MSTNLEPQSRQEWIAACQFHELTESQVFSQIFERIEQEKKSGKVLVLLDLDSTLYEVKPRTFQIIKEWVETQESQSFPAIQFALKNLHPDQVGYSLQDTFQKAGLDISYGGKETELVLKNLKNFWRQRFFSNAYLPYDQPYPGANEFVCKLHEQEVEVVYLTGRDDPNMGEGTRNNLVRDGFPWDTQRVSLMMKKEFKVPDLLHKKQAAEYVCSQGQLVASFENEPANLIALYDLFPQTMHVFVDTVYSDYPAYPRKGLYRIRGFKTTAYSVPIV